MALFFAPRRIELLVIICKTMKFRFAFVTTFTSKQLEQKRTGSFSWPSQWFKNLDCIPQRNVWRSRICNALFKHLCQLQYKLQIFFTHCVCYLFRPPALSLKASLSNYKRRLLYVLKYTRTKLQNLLKPHTHSKWIFRLHQL